MGLVRSIGHHGAAGGRRRLCRLVLVDALSLRPQTRDGRVTADIVTIAPEVSGRVIELRVVENQNVEAGDVALPHRSQRST